MSDFITEEIECLQEKTDEEIMAIYSKQIVGRFPSMVVLKALDIIMAKRNLKPIKLIISLKYQDPNNNEKLIQVTPL